MQNINFPETIQASTSVPTMRWTDDLAGNSGATAEDWSEPTGQRRLLLRLEPSSTLRPKTRGHRNQVADSLLQQGLSLRLELIGAICFGTGLPTRERTRSPDELAINTNSIPACSQTDGDFFKSGNKEASCSTTDRIPWRGEPFHRLLPPEISN